jgi:MFS family permease
MYELAMLLVFVENIPADYRVRILTLFNLANALAILLGSLIGGAILSVVGETQETYWLLFTLSSLGRCAAILVLAPLSRPAIAAVFRLFHSAAPRPAILSLGPAMLPGTLQSEDCLARPKGRFATAGGRCKVPSAAGTHATAIP